MWRVITFYNAFNWGWTMKLSQTFVFLTFYFQFVIYFSFSERFVWDQIIIGVVPRWRPPHYIIKIDYPFFFIYETVVLRWLQATKSIISGTNTQALTAKADSLKEEVDEAMNKMELCKVLMYYQPECACNAAFLVAYGFHTYLLGL